MIYTLENIKYEILNNGNPVVKRRVFGKNTINAYRLEKELFVKLSNGIVLMFPENYEWDLASTPRFLWHLFPPDSDAELAFLIHDFLYENQIESREFADKEMLKWSKVLNGTNKISLRNFDNYARYYAVRWFGKKAWNN